MAASNFFFPNIYVWYMKIKTFANNNVPGLGLTYSCSDPTVCVESDFSNGGVVVRPCLATCLSEVQHQPNGHHQPVPWNQTIDERQLWSLDTNRDAGYKTLTTSCRRDWGQPQQRWSRDAAVLVSPVSGSHPWWWLRCVQPVTTIDLDCGPRGVTDTPPEVPIVQ